MLFYLKTVISNDARHSTLSMSSQTAQAAPLYVAELTESQAFVADIPPLVNNQKQASKTRCLIFFL